MKLIERVNEIVEQASSIHSVAQRLVGTEDERDEARRALATSQAQVRALREALVQLCSWATPIEVEPAGMLGPSFNNEWRACVSQVRAALAAPADETALREFGLRVARWQQSHPDTAEESVDAVLKGER